MAIYTNKTDGDKIAFNNKKSPFLKANTLHKETVFLNALNSYYVINCELGNKLNIFIPPLDIVKKSFPNELVKKIEIEINGSFEDGDILIKTLGGDKFDGETYGVIYALNHVRAEFTITDNNTWLGTNITKI